MKKYDFIIIGSGVGGLSLAIRLASHFPLKRIAILTKSNLKDCSTEHAQGGIAVVQNLKIDSLEKHIQDTLVCGRGLCRKKTVEVVVKSAPKVLLELIHWGMKVDRNKNTLPHLGREGGHCEDRIVHYKDQSGAELMRTLSHKIAEIATIHVLEHHFAIDLIVSNNKCIGVEVFDICKQALRAYSSSYIILATGGIGQVYERSTNSAVSTGDGIAMAKRAGAKIKHMEFVQFHPTAFYATGNDNQRAFLISEAARGAGAVLRNERGAAFMQKYDSRKDLAPRDVVSQSIFEELQNQQKPYVFLDCTKINATKIRSHFPMIHQKCIGFGVDLCTSYIPVVPVQHYCCGGVCVDEHGETSVQNLFACGEVAYTGLHGANRLASNSLLEALVYSKLIFNAIKSNFVEAGDTGILKHSFGNKMLAPTSKCRIVQIKKEIQHIMQSAAGIKRNKKSMREAKNTLIKLKRELTQVPNDKKVWVEFQELRNIMEVGELILNQSLKREKSVGCFWVQA